MHVIVYGEFIQAPQVQYAKALTNLLPENLQSVYFTSSGAEATEGAMKLAKRVTKRTKIISFIGGFLSLIVSCFIDCNKLIFSNRYLFKYNAKYDKKIDIL
jgi:glutamate-1-semialdehyde aminotransferase